MHLAYLGLGNMGSEISAHLATYASKNNHTLTVWNRSTSKYDGLRDLIKGATFAQDLSEIKGADVVFMMLLNDAASSDVLAKVLEVCGGKPAVIVDQSSVNPKTSGESRERARRAGASGCAEGSGRAGSWEARVGASRVGCW